TLPLSPLTRQVAGSNPARSIRAPVAQLVEQFSAVTPRPQQSFGHGPERDGSRVERPAQAGRSQGSKPAPVSPRRESRRSHVRRETPRPCFLATRERRRRRSPT